MNEGIVRQIRVRGQGIIVSRVDDTLVLDNMDDQYPASLDIDVDRVEDLVAALRELAKGVS